MNSLGQEFREVLNLFSKLIYLEGHSVTSLLRSSSYLEGSGLLNLYFLII